MQRERIPLGDGTIYRECRVWMLDATFEGKRVRQSLGTRDRWEAIRKAVALLKTRCPGFSRLTVKEKIDVILPGLEDTITHEEMAEIVERKVAIALLQGKFVPKSVPVEQALKEYIAYQEGTKRSSKDHISNVKNQLQKFLAFVPAVRVITEIRAAQIAEYIASCTAKGDAAKTVKGKLGAVSAWLAWARDISAYVSANSAEKIPAPKISRQDIIFLAANEALRALEAVKGDVVEPIVATALYAGLRREELAQLETSDLSLEKRVLRVRNKARWSTKTRYGRSVPVLDQLVPHLMKLPRSEGHLFLAGKGGDWTSNLDRLSERVRELLEPVVGREKASLQVMRHSFCTHLRLLGVEPFTASKWAGHSPTVQEKCYAGYELGEQPLQMTFHGLPLERHGLPAVPNPRAASRS